MRGMIFTEFMDMVETRWSLDMVDAIIARSRVASEGAYTAVGSYSHEELASLAQALSQETGMAVSDLVRSYGRHLFGRFAQLYPRFFEPGGDCLGFLAGLEDIIHAEVRKLYPDVDLPTFEVERSSDRLVLRYFSSHPFPDLAHGLIAGCIEHFGEDIDILRENDLAPGDGQARFTLLAKG